MHESVCGRVRGGEGVLEHKILVHVLLVGPEEANVLLSRRRRWAMETHHKLVLWPRAPRRQGHLDTVGAWRCAAAAAAAWRGSVAAVRFVVALMLVLVVLVMVLGALFGLARQLPTVRARIHDWWLASLGGHEVMWRNWRAGTPMMVVQGHG